MDADLDVMRRTKSERVVRQDSRPWDSKDVHSHMGSTFEGLVAKEALHADVIT